MRPQLVTLDAGNRNRDLRASTQRYVKGGSWKKQRIVVIIPAGDTIPSKVYLAHRGLIFPPNQPNHWILAVGMEVGDAYSSTVESVLAHPDLSQWEYVVTLEHDNIPPSDGVLRLLERIEAHPELSCISGLYWTKGELGVPQIWGDPKDPSLNFRPIAPVPEELVECCGTGMGFAIWRMSMFRDPNIARPLFQTKCSREGVGTQDLAFWGEARKWGYRCAVDCAVRVAHYDLQTDTSW